MLVLKNIQMISEKQVSCSFVLESKSNTNITQSQHYKIRNKLIFKNTLAKYSDSTNCLTTKKISNSNGMSKVFYIDT